jgi:hypothetical protein
MARSHVRATKSSVRKPTHYKPVIEALEDRLVLDGYGLHLDFGTPNSPVDKAFVQFGATPYAGADSTYGWASPKRVEAYDTGLGSDLTRDGVRGVINTFTAQVPNGKYEVSALLGNERSFNDRITIFSNHGVVQSNLTNYRQRIVPLNFTTEVKNGTFRLTLVDAGGQHRFFSIASLQINQVTGTGGGGGGGGGSNPLIVNAGTGFSRNEGTAAVFSGLVSGGTAPYQYTWTYGDGSQSTGSLNPSKTYADSGTYQVTLSVTDAANVVSSSSLQVTINNVAPTATFATSGQVQQGNSGTVQFSGQADPSATDVNAGFRYSYDFNNDGTFEVTNSNSSSATVPANFLSSPGTYTIKGRIADKDGGATDYSTSVVVVSVNNGDTTPPTATVLSPGANSTLTGSVTFTASASDNVGVTGVQYFLNNQAISPVLTTGNYQFTWNSSSFSNGNYTIKAIAKDAAGNAGTSAGIPVVVSNTFDNPLDKPVLNSTNFSYVGSFNLPYTANGWSTAFSRSGLTHRYVDGQLRFFTTSHVYSGGLVYEFNDPGTAASGTLPQASVVRNWGDVYSGNKSFAGSSALTGQVETNGLYYDETLNRLYWSYGYWYNADYPFNPSIGYSDLNDGTGVATGAGAWSLTNRPEKFNRGGFLEIPQWFANSYTGGKTLGVGFGGYYSIIGSGSFGPALAAIDHPNIQSNPHLSSLANTALIGYPYNSNTRAERNPNYYSTYDGGAWNASNGVGYWSWSDEISGGGTWIDTASSGGVLILARLGQGNVYYANSHTNADSYSFEWMVYDPKDLADVAQGVKQQWQIQPKYRWNDSTLVGAGNVGSNMVGGMTYDETTGRLYVLVNGANYVGFEPYPRMYVYQVGSGSPSMLSASQSLSAPVQVQETVQKSSEKVSVSKRFQFGQSDSPTLDGYQKVTLQEKYQASTGYGWLSGELWNVKKDAGSSFSTQGIGTKDGTFKVDLPNGEYRVTVRFGNPTQLLEKVSIGLQGRSVAVAKSTPGNLNIRTFKVKVTDGTMSVSLKNLDNTNRMAVLSGLDIVSV